MKIQIAFGTPKFDDAGEVVSVEIETEAANVDFDVWAKGAKWSDLSPDFSDDERDLPSEAKVARARAALEAGKPFYDFDDEGTFVCSDAVLVLRVA